MDPNIAQLPAAHIQMDPDTEDDVPTPLKRAMHWVMGTPKRARRNGSVGNATTPQTRPFSWGVALSRMGWKWLAWLWDHPLRKVVAIILGVLGGVLLAAAAVIIGATYINHSVAAVCDLPYLPLRSWVCSALPSPVYSPDSVAVGPAVSQNAALNEQEGPLDKFDRSLTRADQIPRLLRKLELSIRKAAGLIGSRESPNTPRMNRLLDDMLSAIDALLPRALAIQPLFNYVMDSIVMVHQMESTYAFRSQDSWGLAVYGTRLTEDETPYEEPSGELAKAIRDLLANVDNLMVAVEEVYSSVFRIKQSAHDLYVVAERELYDTEQAGIKLQAKFWTMIGGNRYRLLGAEEWRQYAYRLRSVGEEALALVIYLRSDVMELSSQVEDLRRRVLKLSSTEHGPARIGLWASIGYIYQRFVVEKRITPGSMSWIETLSSETNKDTRAKDTLDSVYE